MANRRFIDFPIASTSGDTDIILIWQDGANKQTTKATFLSGLPENLEDLNDVVISGLTNGQILRYDSVTGKWENTDQGNLDLNDLNDVSIVSPSNGQVLVYNSSTSQWENSSGGYVPYTGAVTTVNLGAQQLIAGQTTLTTNGSADTLTVNHTSGSGKAINVTKGGNGEGLYINKTSGSGNAATIVGTLEATTLVKTGGTSAQFLKADGSVDSTSYQPLLTNPVTGTGASGQVAFWSGTTSQTGDNGLFWDNTNKRLGVGTATPTQKLHISSTSDTNIILESHDGTQDCQVRFRTTRASTTVSDKTAVFALGSTNSVGTIVETLFLNNNNVGIGTNAPASILEVSQSLSPIFRISSSAVTIPNLTDIGTIEFYSNDASTSARGVKSFVKSVAESMGANQGSASLVFGTSANTEVNSTERWRITPAGIFQSNGAQTIQTSTGNLTLTSADNTGIVDIRRNNRSFGAELRLTNAASGSSWAAGDIVGTLNFVSDDASTSQPIRSQIQAISTGGTTYPTNMNLTFSTANVNTLTEGFRLTNLSNFLIGTTTDAGFRLDVNGTARVQSNLNVSTGGITLTGAQTIQTSTGNLTLATAAGNGHIILSPNGTGNVLIGAIADVASLRREIVMRGANGSLLSLGNNINADRFQIVSDSGENALLNNKANTPMILYTNNTERMRITAAGRVLIGTTTESTFLLDVNGTARVSGAATFSSSVTATQGIFSGNVGIGTINPSAQLNVGHESHGVGISYLGSSALPLLAGIFTSDGTAGGQTGYGSLLVKARSDYGAFYSINFFTAASDNTPVERMRITSGGNVLIGTTTDNGYKLRVNGSVLAGNHVITSGSTAPALNATGTLASGVSYAIIAIYETTNTGNGCILLMAAGVLTLVSNPSGVYTTTVNTANKWNVTVSASVISIQNNRANGDAFNATISRLD